MRLEIKKYAYSDTLRLHIAGHIGTLHHKENKDMRLRFWLLTQAVPALGGLLIEIIRLDKTKADPMELNQLWYSEYKPRMEQLVGMYANNPNPVVNSSEAYDCAYENLYECLTGERLR